MALNIKNPETHQLAQELAKLTNQTLTQAVTKALKDAIKRQQKSSEPRLHKLEKIALHCASLRIQDPRSANDILGYDDQGLP